MDSSAVSKRNTDGLKSFAQKKKANTLQKVNDAIQRLIKDKAKINFNSVSMESVVTLHTFIIIRSCEIELKLYVTNKKAYHPQNKLKEK